MAQRGRPKKRQLVTLKKALVLLQQRLMEKYNDIDVVAEMMPAKKTIYNKVAAKKLTNYGDRTCMLLDVDDVYSLVG